MSEGRVRIEIPPQGDALDPMRGFVRESIQQIVGKDRMKSFAELLGPQFEAKFAYFGQYRIALELAFDGAQMNDAKFVTMRSEYTGVEIRNAIGGGRITSTSVLPVDRFETAFFPLEKLRPRE